MSTATSSPKIFISYAHDDRNSKWVRHFAKALENHKMTVWLDEWQIPAGASISDAIETGLRESDAIVAVLSPENASSPNVFFELGVALGMGKLLIPIISRDTDNSQIPFDIRSRRYLIQADPDETAREVAATLSNTTLTSQA